AQPEDSIPPTLLSRRVGPMDNYQIKWGYMPIPTANSPEEELPFLEELIKKQDNIPWFRYTKPTNPAIGPGFTNEVSDNNNPIESMKLGIKNLKRVLDLIPNAVGQNDIVLMEELHYDSIKFWYNQMCHVLSMIGGYSVQYKKGDQEGPVYTPIPELKQLEAVEFLLENAFDPPDWLSNPEYSSRFQISSANDRLLYFQLKLVEEFMDSHRMKRLYFMDKNYSMVNLQTQVLMSLQNALFWGLSTKNVKIERRRQILQIKFLMELESILFKNRGGTHDDINNLVGNTEFIYTSKTLRSFKEIFEKLKKYIEKALPSTPNMTVKKHWINCLEYY